ADNWLENYNWVNLRTEYLVFFYIAQYSPWHNAVQR
ncbi:MAG: hypothetical protein ACI82S_002424, partial [Patiriisocius sp.]